MRIGLVIILALSLALLGSAAGDGGQVRQKPTLKLSGRILLTLRGEHFRSNEKVRVTVLSEQKRTKHVRANGVGGFIVRFQIGFDRCSGLIAIAVGQRGSEAMLKLPRPACPAP